MFITGQGTNVSPDLAVKKKSRPYFDGLTQVLGYHYLAFFRVDRDPSRKPFNISVASFAITRVITSYKRLFGLRETLPSILRVHV